MASLSAQLTPVLLFFGLLGWTLVPVEVPTEARDWRTLRSRRLMVSSDGPCRFTGNWTTAPLAACISGEMLACCAKPSTCTLQQSARNITCPGMAEFPACCPGTPASESGGSNKVSSSASDSSDRSLQNRARDRLASIDAGWKAVYPNWQPTPYGR